MNKAQQNALEFSKATALLQQGRFAEAIPVYEAILRREPRNIGAVNLLGIALMQTGRLEEAASAIRKALSISHNQPDAHYNLAAVLQALGRFEEAISHLQKVISLKPADAFAHNNLGVALKSLGRHEEATEAYHRAIALKPDYAEALVNLAAAIFQLRQHSESILYAERALAINSNLAEAHLVIGNSLWAKGKFDESLAAFGHAIALQPNRPESYAGAGNTLVESGSHYSAIPYFEKALMLTPHSVTANFKLANSLYLTGRYKEAEKMAEQGFANQFVDIHDEIAAATYLQYVNRQEDAIRHYQNALKLDPASKVALLGCGNTLFSLNRLEEALDYFDKSLSLGDDDNTTPYNKALVCLALGRFAEGWKLYEYRYTPAVKVVIPYTFSAPRWDGQNLPGTLLVWGEQGLGDQIIYISMVSEIIGRASSIVLMVEKRLVSLMARSFPQLKICTFEDGTAFHFDAQIAMADLGSFYRKSWEQFPRKPYLVADKERSKKLRETLHQESEIAIGISWRSMNFKAGEHKTARLGDFAPILKEPGIRPVDLQYGDTKSELESIHGNFGISITHIDEIDNTNDIDGLASLIDACDIVLTVSNTTAHIAGALGKPVWVMVPYGQGRPWYWFRDRADSPWYPGARIVRQQPGQSWAELVASITPEIVEFAANLKKQKQS